MSIHQDLGMLLVIVGGLLIVSVQTSPRILDPFEQSGLSNLAIDKGFDILILAQQWPKTFCNSFQKPGSSQPCRLPDDNRWTIHGLWPSRIHGAHPAYCDKTAGFNASKIAGIEKELNAKWPSLDGKKSSRVFWAHEWEKHGTCSSALGPINSQEKYFKKTMQLRDKFYVKNILEELDILPGGSYNVQDVVDGVSEVLGTKCVVSYSCNQDKTESYLSEIQICFDKSFNLVDCDGNIEYPRKCSATEDVIYPEHTPIDYLE